jgi:quercetin dioxygenase-like cupin family protein
MRELHGPGGFVLRIVSDDGEVLKMEARYAGDGVLPPEHMHPHQTERFEVLEGSVRVIVPSGEQVHVAGDVFEIGQGTRHRMTADEPARVLWQVRPALRTAEFFERLYTGQAGEGFLEEFSAEIRLTGG